MTAIQNWILSRANKLWQWKRNFAQNVPGTDLTKLFFRPTRIS